MDILSAKSNMLANIDLDPPNVHQEVLQNCAIILESIKNTIPMIREMGISGEYLGRPLNVIENEIVAEVYDQIEKYEPRAIIAGVTVEVDHMTGQMIPTVELEGVDEDAG